MRRRLVTPLVLLLGLSQCREAPPYIEPSRYVQAGEATAGQVPKLFAAALPTGEDLPDDVTADALQMGWFCFDLPLRSRPRMLPARGDGKLRVVQDDGQGGLEVLAVDLATRVATTETALEALDDQLTQAGGVHRVAFLPDSATPAGIDGLTPQQPLADQPTATVAWLQWQRGALTVDLAQDATHVQQFAVDGQGQLLWMVDAPPDTTPVAWQVALGDPATATLVGPVLALWAVVQGGAAAVVRAQGDAGPQTELLAADGARRRLGPDGVAVIAVGPAVLIATATGELLRVDAATGRLEIVRTGGRPARLVAGGGQPAVAMADAQSATALYWFDGVGLQRVAALGPAQWLAAVPLKGGVAAALLDRSAVARRDGSPDVALCVVAPAVKPLLVPLR